jgi:hypothetical protein
MVYLTSVYCLRSTVYGLRSVRLSDESRSAKLLKFVGRPDEYSPKARLKMMFGHPAPFDRCGVWVE